MDERVNSQRVRQKIRKRERDTENYKNSERSTEMVIEVQK